MGDDEVHGLTEVAAQVESILRRGVEMEAEIDSQGAATRERSKRAYGPVLLDARLTLMGVIATLIDARQLDAGETDASRSDRLILTMSFLQGTSSAERLISEGQYIKAAAALRQDMEIVVRLRETLEGTARPGRTPQLGVLSPAVRSAYGLAYSQLSGVAHPSRIELLVALLSRHDHGEVHGVSPVPIFVRETAIALYELHVLLLLEVCRELVRLHEELYPLAIPLSPEADALLLGTMERLKAAGHIREAGDLS